MVVEACAELRQESQALKGLQMTNDPQYLRHFMARFEEVEG